ncbi:hypothetical protein MKZ24_11815 [Paenibacillus sp. FSL R7-0297]
MLKCRGGWCAGVLEAAGVLECWRRLVCWSVEAAGVLTCRGVGVLKCRGG